MNNSVSSAMTFLCKRMPSDLDITPSDYAFLLMDFQEKKGDEYIEGLAGFYLYAIRNLGKKSSKAILQTFIHDLNGINDKFCEPKCGGYAEIWRKEYADFIQKTTQS